MTHVFRTPTAIVRSCNSFASNHPDYDVWGKAGFNAFVLKTTDPLLTDGVAATRAAHKRVSISVDYQGESQDAFLAKALKAHTDHKPEGLILELEDAGGLMPFQMQAPIFAALRKNLGSETAAPLGVFVPPMKTWPGSLEIDYGGAVDAGFFILVELYGKTNDVVIPPLRAVGSIMAWFNEPAARWQGIGGRRIVCIVSAGQAAYFLPKLAGTGTHGLFYWCADDDQAAGDAGKYLSLFGPQPEKEYVAWT